jgi:hypothetical protein
MPSAPLSPADMERGARRQAQIDILGDGFWRQLREYAHCQGLQIDLFMFDQILFRIQSRQGQELLHQTGGAVCAQGKLIQRMLTGAVVVGSLGDLCLGF